jgi:hypothetical protein
VPGIKDLLHEDYLAKRPPAKGKMSDLKDNPELSGETPPAPMKVKKPRTIDNVFVALEAQKVYFPQIPSVPNPQPAPANTFQKGVTPALGNTGAWGAPEGEK